jgi:hypothetical protein
MFAHMDHALANLDRASGDLQLTMAAAKGTLGDKDKGALANVAQAAAELHGAAADMRVLMKGLNGPVSELSNSTLPQATEALDSVQRAAARFDSLADQLQQNPGAVLNSKPAKEVELPR